MTGSLRGAARNPIGVALMGALILVFLVLGVGGGRFPDAFRSVSADSVISVGDHSTSARDFERVFEGQKQKIEQQAQQQLTNEFLVQNGLDAQILDGVAAEQSGLELLQRSGVKPGPTLVDAEIKKMPIAFDKVTGQFSQAQFVQALAAQGLTPRQAQAELTDELADRHFGYAAAAGLKAPALFAALTAVAATESRDVSYFTLGIKSVPAPPKPTDAQLQDFIKAHAAQLTVPETRVITLVKFSAKDLASTVKIDPAQVAKEFEFRKDSLSQPEKRTLVEIPVKSPAEGAAASQRLSRGEDPNVVAKSLGVEALSYADKPQGAVADRKVAAAAFAMKAGEVSGPVAGDLGLAVIKLDKITPGAAATLESARPQIETELRQKAAADQAYQQSETFDKIRQGGSSLADAAAKTGVPTQTLGPVTDKGQDADGKANPILTDKMLKAAFLLPAGQDGDLEDAGSGEYFAVRADKVIPAHLPTVTDKRPELTQAWTNEQIITAIKAKANALMAQARKDGALDKAAASAGVKVTHEAGMQRIKAQQYQALGREFLGQAFGAKPGDVFAAGGKDGVYIARVDQVKPGDPGQTAQLTAAIRGRISQSYASDIMNAMQAAARDVYKPTINTALARKTIGVDPNLGGAATKPAAGKAK